MEDLRSKSVGHGKMQQQQQQQLDHGGFYGSGGGGGAGMQDLRCYSASYATAPPPPPVPAPAANNDAKLKKGRSANGVSKSWSFSDPESQRKRRVASYKVYAVEGKVKGSLRKSFRWLKERCSRVVYGW